MIIPNNYGTVAHKFLINATAEQNVITHGFHNTTLMTAIDCATLLATTWDNDCTGALLSDQWTYVGAYALISIGGTEQSAEYDINSVGTNGNGPPPPAVAIGVKKATSYAGKKYRGRFYLPAGYIGENHVNQSGVIDAGNVSSLQTIMDNYLADIDAGDLPMYLLHNDATAPTPVMQLIVRDMVRTQRRRQKFS